MSWSPKDPADVASYCIDWSAFLPAGDTISTFTLTVPSDLTVQYSNLDSTSQNVGLIAMTGVMSRHVVTIGAVFLILCGLLPKIGAVITTIPIEVLGGGVIVMFGMVASAALSMLSAVVWNQRNMLIFGVALSLSLGLQLEPAALAHVPETLRILLTSGVLPAAIIALLLNLVLPAEVGKS